MKKKKVFEFKPYEPPLKVKATATVREMVDLLIRHQERHYLCVLDENEKLLGLISRRRLFQAVFSHHVPADSRMPELFILLTSEEAGDLLLKNIITIEENDDINKIISILVQHGIDELPVVNKEKKVIGIVSLNMILQEWCNK
jgi:CBS domain-containing protein